MAHGVSWIPDRYLVFFIIRRLDINRPFAAYLSTLGTDSDEILQIQVFLDESLDEIFLRVGQGSVNSYQISCVALTRGQHCSRWMFEISDRR